jgi:hypothetical protein
MSLVNAVRVELSSLSAGTITLGPAVTGFKTMTAADAVDGDEYDWVIEANFGADGAAANREGGYGVWDSGTNTLVRTTVWSSETFNTPITVTGDAHVIITPLASRLVNNTRFFATRTSAAAATIPPEVLLVEVGGRTDIGDAGAAHYKYVAAEPSTTAKFQSANGRWFELVQDQPYYTPGLIGNNSADNNGVLTAALEDQLYSTTRRFIKFGPGVYYFADDVEITVGNDEAIALEGCGEDVTELRFASGKGLIINYAVGFLYASTVTISNMTIATDGAGTATGIKLFSTQGSNQSAMTQTTLSNLAFHGHGEFDVEGSLYWDIAVDVRGVSNVNFYNCFFFSVLNTGSGKFDLGTGVSFRALSGYSCTQFNMTSCSWLDVGVGIAWGSTLEDSVEGLTLVGCNMVGGQYGILHQSGGNPTTQVSITNSQFNLYDVAIFFQNPCSFLSITNCLFIAAIESTSGTCILLRDTDAFGSNFCNIISGNSFLATGTGKEGIVVTDVSGVTMIGNWFSGFATLSILTEGDASNILCAHNQYNNSIEFANTSANTSTIWRGLKCTTLNTTSIASP